MSFVCDALFFSRFCSSLLAMMRCTYTSCPCCPPLQILTDSYCRCCRKQGNSTHSCEGNGVAVTENNSVVLVGYTEGRFANQSIGEGDFAAVKIDSDGHEVWRWQASSNNARTMSVPRESYAYTLHENVMLLIFHPHLR